jgi:hypothetical protein
MFELVDLHAQGLVAGAQRGELALPLSHQRQQFLTAHCRKVFGLKHGRHYKPFVWGPQVNTLINDLRSEQRQIVNANAVTQTNIRRSVAPLDFSHSSFR